jgi:hypothetical protein
MKGFGLGLNNGWYNSASTHKPLGVSITFNGTAAFFPSSDKFYQFVNSDYTSVRLSDPTLEEDRSPTAVGPTRSGPQVDIYDPNTGITLGTMDLPQGIGLKFDAVPVAVPQVSVGIVKNTDIMFRYLPDIKIGDDGKIKFWGLGFKHDIKQWIPGMRFIPFHLSLLVGYTNMDARYDFTEYITPTDQEKIGEYDVRALTVQALISKKLSVITFYGGLGFNSVRSNFAAKGTYEVDIDGNGTIDVVYEDPLDFDVKDSGLAATLGFRLKLAVLTLHGDYTFSEYNVLNFGLGFSFRESGSMAK